MRKYKQRSRKGRKYKSKLESNVAKRLGRRAIYEVDKLDYVVPAKKRTYSVDFTVDGKIFLEVKGFLRYEDQMKMRYVKECNPEADIRFYFPKDSKVHMSKLKNSEWCDKYGFRYYIGTLPSKDE